MLPALKTSVPLLLPFLLVSLPCLPATVQYLLDGLDLSHSKAPDSQTKRHACRARSNRAGQCAGLSFRYSLQEPHFSFNPEQAALRFIIDEANAVESLFTQLYILSYFGWVQVWMSCNNRVISCCKIEKHCDCFSQCNGLLELNEAVTSE